MSEQLSMLPPLPPMPPAEPPIDHGPEFEAWWAAYPRKVSKGTARRAYIAARRHATAEELADGLARYRFSPERRYQPHASTWLNGERWRDDPEPDLAADPWGLREWLSAQPVALSGAMFDPAGYTVDALGDILTAAGFAPEWRGNLDTLGNWIRAGYRPDSIAEVIAEAAASTSADIRSLAFFDGLVRRRSWRWDARRHEWVRERP